eukprot:2597147-Prymnesium_polylepis.2
MRAAVLRDSTCGAPPASRSAPRARHLRRRALIDLGDVPPEAAAEGRVQRIRCTRLLALEPVHDVAHNLPSARREEE